MGGTFSAPELKMKLKAGVERMKLRMSGKQNQIKKERRKVAELLGQAKYDSARIHVEGVISSQKFLQVYERLILMSELLIQRIGMIKAEALCPQSLLEAVATLIFCANQVDIQELVDIAKMFAMKYGKDWVQMHRNNGSSAVNPEVDLLLGVAPPDIEMVVDTLRKIADDHDIELDETKIFNHQQQPPGPPVDTFPTQPGPSGGLPPHPGAGPSGYPPQAGPPAGDLGYPGFPGGGAVAGGNWGAGPPMGTPAIPPPGGYVEPPQPGPPGGIGGQLPGNHYSQFAQPGPASPALPTNTQPQGPAAQPGTLGAVAQGGDMGAPAPGYDELEERFNKLGQ